MSQLHLKFTRVARAHLKSIGRYTEETWGIEQRDAYLGKLYVVCEMIRKSPHSGRIRDELYLGMLSKKAEKHIIYYFAEENQIVIAGILHERMEPSLHL